MSERRKNPVLTCALVRKRCACGKQVTAKQLTSYGGCDACYKVRVAASNTNRAAQ